MTSLQDVCTEMIKIPGMIIIGAGHRNVGKTEFACSLIRKFGPANDVVAVKVTTVADSETACPRGGKGCGACTSFGGNYHLGEETNLNSDKDTCRMLVAGAKKVFWLRVLKSHLEEGLNALTNAVGPDKIIVCESNSLRLVAEPDLFLIFKSSASTPFKPSAAEVQQYADRVVTFDGTGFDIDIKDVQLHNNRWIAKTGV